MKKYIYGRCFSFNFAYEIPEIDGMVLSDYNTMEFSSNLKLTINHDFENPILLTEKNIDIVVNQYGIYFRYLVDCERGKHFYRKVKNRAITKCSCSFLWGSVERYKDEPAFDREMYIEKNNLMFEFSLVKIPIGINTFCTIHATDSRLRGIDWTNRVKRSNKNVITIGNGKYQITYEKRVLPPEVNSMK